MRGFLVLSVGLLVASSGCSATPDSTGPVSNATERPAAETFAGSGLIEAPMDVDATAAGTDAQVIWERTDCVLQSGYADLMPGNQVVIEDGEGTIIATGKISSSLVYQGQTDLLADAYCGVSFRVFGIPASTRYYVVKVGNIFRGEQVFEREELEAGVRLSVG